MMKRSHIFLSLVVLGSLIVACNFPTQANPSHTPTENPTDIPAQPTQTAEPAEHRIGVRVVNGVGEFYDRLTNQKFIPRGNNYIQLGAQKKWDGTTQIYHVVFDPGTYDSKRIAAAFEQMHSQGYNIVRVFLSQNTIGTNSGGLDPAYMENVVDFLRLAKQNDLYVIPTIDWLPGGKYNDILLRDCCDKFTMMNVNFLTPAGLAANQAFFQDFVRYLREHGAPMDALFAYELRNELFFDMDYPPLSLTSGLLPTADGKSYDMADPKSKKLMMDENLIYWIDHMRASILELDPTALVTVGFFWPQEPNPARIGDERYISTRPAIWDSKLDFIDLHSYPASELNLKQYVENFGMKGMQVKPIIMGEFGVAKASISSEQAAAGILMNWQVESCRYGFDGWLLWEWNAVDSSEFYDPMSGNGYVNKALAPINRPDACVPSQ